jgi:hypothetical protein
LQATQMPGVALDRNILPDEASNSGHACLPITAIKQGPARDREALPCGERAKPPPIEDIDRPTWRQRTPRAGGVGPDTFLLTFRSVKTHFWIVSIALSHSCTGLLPYPEVLHG